MQIDKNKGVLVHLRAGGSGLWQSLVLLVCILSQFGAVGGNNVNSAMKIWCVGV